MKGKYKMSENLHAKHRERMRARFIETNAAGFSDHELLELILFYAIPRRNTNDIAHNLIHHFGSFEGVFCASIDELQQVEGIGATAAVYLKSIFAAHNRMMLNTEHETYKTYEEIGELFVKKYRHINTETMILVLFDKKGRICREVTIAVGDTNGASVDMKKLAAACACENASFAAVAHNHPSGNIKSSFDDEYVTVNINDALQNMRVKLIDHYIIADGNYQGILKSRLVGDLRSR